MSYSRRGGRSVVIKQWFVHKLRGGEQTVYVHGNHVLVTSISSGRYRNLHSSVLTLNCMDILVIYTVYLIRKLIF